MSRKNSRSFSKNIRVTPNRILIYFIIAHLKYNYNSIFLKDIEKIQKCIKKILTMRKKMFYTISENINKNIEVYVSVFVDFHKK